MIAYDWKKAVSRTCVLVFVGMLFQLGSAQAAEPLPNVVAAAPIDEMMRRLNSASAHLDQLLADPGLKRSVDNVAAFTGDLRRLSGNGELDRMVKNLNDLAGRLDGMVGDNQYDVRVIIQDLRVTADNLRAVSESIKRYPAGALIGGPPDRIQVPGSMK